MIPEFQQVLLKGSEKIYHVTGDNRFGESTTIARQFEGFITNLERRYSETESDFIRREIEQFMYRETCPACAGRRLKPEALGVTVDHQNISEITNLTILRAFQWSQNLAAETAANTALSQKKKPLVPQF
jgi:excinuclease UvrABC ATPase subunit